NTWARYYQLVGDHIGFGTQDRIGGCRRRSLSSRHSTDNLLQLVLEQGERRFRGRDIVGCLLLRAHLRQLVLLEGAASGARPQDTIAPEPRLDRQVARRKSWGRGHPGATTDSPGSETLARRAAPPTPSPAPGRPR